MGKKNKSKRFIQQGADAVMKHDARFPYRGTLAEAEKARSNSSLEGSKWGTYYFNKLEMLLQMLYLVQAASSNKDLVYRVKNAFAIRLRKFFNC